MHLVIGTVITVIAVLALRNSLVVELVAELARRDRRRR